MFCFFVCWLPTRYITPKKYEIKIQRNFGSCKRVSAALIGDLSYHLIVVQLAGVLAIKPDLNDLHGGLANSRLWPKKSALAGADR